MSLLLSPYTLLKHDNDIRILKKKSYALKTLVLTGNINCSGIVFIPEGLRNQVLRKESDSSSSRVKDINGENISLQSIETEEIDYSESKGKREILAVSCSHCGTSKPMTPDEVAVYYSVASFCKEQLDLCKDHYCILLLHACSQTFPPVYSHVTVV